VTKSAGDGPDVYAGADQLGRGEVPKVMKADAFQAEGVPYPDEEAGYVVRTERTVAIEVGRKT
jgi:hypothetical protein